MNLKLSKKEIDYMLIGLIYGDGYYKNGIISISHTNKQKFYV